MSPAADPENSKYGKGKAVDPARYHQARIRTEQLSWGGILTAMGWLFLCLSFWWPTASLLLRGSSVFALLIAEFRIGRTGALLVYVATSLLTLLYPGYYTLLPYLVYFAPYLLIAFYLARFKGNKRIVLLRLLIGCILFMSLITIYGDTLLPGTWREKIGEYYWLIMIFLGIVGTAVYDYLLAFASLLYSRRLEPYFREKR